MAKAYPTLHTAFEGLCFGYQLLYLLDVTKYYSPMLKGAGVVVRRSTGQEMVSSAESPSFSENFFEGSDCFLQAGMRATVVLFAGRAGDRCWGDGIRELRGDGERIVRKKIGEFGVEQFLAPCLIETGELVSSFLPLSSISSCRPGTASVMLRGVRKL
jgi:hypothetical protein